MRSLLKIVMVFAVISFVGSASAQTKVQKIGHIDFAKLYQAIPGQDTIQAQFAAYQKSLNDDYNKSTAEYTAKLEEYQKGMATMSNIIKQTREKELTDMQDRLKQFEQNAQKDLQDKQNALMAPTIAKANKAINDVAKENGFSYIFNTTDGVLLYSEGGDDIMPLVKKKLNLK
jgi:outer membrane protein